MSKLSHDNRATIRWKLLTGVSILALTVSSAGMARAEDSGQPQIWIELGGQLSRLDDGQEIFAPVFPNSPTRPSIFSPSQKFERPPLYSFDETGKLSFQPEGSDWVLSASLRYGRSSSNRSVHQQTSPKPFVTYLNGYYRRAKYPDAARFADTAARNSERHLIVDFQVGKDVGLGMFGGKNGSSVLNFGVRFAQFSTKSNIALKSDPDWQFTYKYFYGHKIPQQAFHSNLASMQAERSFHGVGPSLSWNASAPFAGTVQDGEFTIDWGVNAALLFGRQRTKVHHQVTGQFAPAYHFLAQNPGLYATYQPAPVNRTRSNSITVPNVGGFAGLSFRYADAKFSFGYRADLFFGAVDGGIDTRKNENRGFFGPFASVSVGLGD
jgi:iron complex outermembrane recepter protein